MLKLEWEPQGTLTPAEVMEQALKRRPSYYASLRRRIAPKLRYTCTVQPRPLQRQGFDQVWVKEECLQYTGSYKARGGLSSVELLTPPQRAGGIICPTAGNGGAGLAYATSFHGIRTTLVLTENSPNTTEERLLSFGHHVEVIRCGEIWDESCLEAKRLARQRSLHFVHPFDSLGFIDGAATLVVEILEELPEATSIIVPVGGGGLLAGVCLAAAAMKPQIKVYGVEPLGAASMRASLDAGKPVEFGHIATQAKSLAVRRVGDLAFGIARRLCHDVVCVNEREVEEAIAFAHSRLYLVVEPAGAVGLAPILSQRLEPRDGPCVVVLSGGILAWPDCGPALRTSGLL